MALGELRVRLFGGLEVDGISARELGSLVGHGGARRGTREDRWWSAAERRAGALITNAGEHAETLQQWVASKFSALGRR